MYQMAFVSFLFLFFSQISYSQSLTCLDKLLPYNKHSGLHQLTRDEWHDGKEFLDNESAKNALIFLTNSRLLCRTDEVIIKVAPSCSLLLADIPQSLTCFAFTNLGYFIISRDNGRNTNFIFSKDKRYSEL